MLHRSFPLVALLLLASCAPSPKSPPAPGGANANANDLGFHDGARVVGAVGDAADARRMCDTTFRALDARRDALRTAVSSGAADGAVLDALLALDAPLHVAGNTAVLLGRVHPSREARLEVAACGGRIDAFSAQVLRGD